jgi:phosphatidylinositol glycan class W
MKIRHHRFDSHLENQSSHSSLTMATLKEQKEAFVTGHDGTTPEELFLVCLCVPLGLWLYQLLKPTKDSTGLLAIGVEAIVLLFPMALCQTNLLYPWGFTLLRAEFALGLVLTGLKKKQKTPPEPTVDSNRLGFVTAYRSSVMYLTFVAILAVDFHVFPRRFAKTETVGYGLMDLGAGSFVVAAGLVSPRARGSGPILSRNAFLRMIPLLVIGMIRLLTTKGLEYQEHVSEYGVHWNFFFTLAMLSPLSALVPYRWETPVLLIAVYQWLLTKEGFQQYTEEGPRSCTNTESWLCDLVAANREGIFGVCGYLALFLGSELLGEHCIWKTEVKRKDRLVIAAVGLWIVHAILTIQGIPVSRRTTNATFCVWTLAQSMSMLALLAFASVKNEVPPIFNAVNRHGLPVFVVANILTGLVNLSMNTLEASDAAAVLVVFLYLCTVGGFALVLDYGLSRISKAKKD